MMENSNIPTQRFGVKDRSDIKFLEGKADIAVMGTRALQLMEARGIAAVGDFIRELRR